MNRSWLDHIDRSLTGEYSVYEVMHRLYTLKANLEVRSNGVHRTDAFMALDASEKSAVSYLLGLTIAKLIIGQTTNLWWLQHLDTYLRTKGYSPSGRRPDLFMRDLVTNETFVVEAKGLSHGFSKGTMESALQQKGPGVWSQWLGEPNWKFASVAFFRKTGLQVELRDPLLDERGFTVRDESEVIRDYYKLVLDLVNTGASGEVWADENSTSEQHAEFPVSLAVIPGLDAKIGLASWVRNALEGDDETLIRVMNGAMSEHPERFPLIARGAAGVDRIAPDQSDQIGRLLMPDGVAVALGPSWSGR